MNIADSSQQYEVSAQIMAAEFLSMQVVGLPSAARWRPWLAILADRGTACRCSMKRSTHLHA
jgi:hypothetical protein